MNEIAEPAPHTPFPAVEPAARFAEIGDGRKLAVDRAGGVPARVEGVAGLLGGIFVLEAGVDVADEVYFISFTHISICLPSIQIPAAVKSIRGKSNREKRSEHTIVVIIANHHLLNLPILAHLAPEILVKGVEMVLQLAGIHLVLGVVGRVLVQVGKEDGLRVRGLDMFA